MQTIEFESYITDNSIHIPVIYQNINNHKAKVLLQIEEKKPSGNYNQQKLLSLFKEAKAINAFRNIEDSIEWQKDVRDEWE